MIMTVVTNSGLLPLLKRIEWAGRDNDCDRVCPECESWKDLGSGKHAPGCELKAAIDQLEAYEEAAKKHREDYLEGRA